MQGKIINGYTLLRPLGEGGTAKKRFAKNLKKIVSFLILIPLFSAQVYAGTVYAVVVGVSNNDANRRNLQYADDDAKTYYSYLIKANATASKSNFTLLVDSEATKERILSAMRQQFSKATANDRVILFFSGHGASGIFVPYDFTSSGFLSHSEIKTVFKNCKASLKICIADACFSGSFKKPVVNRPNTRSNTLGNEVIMFMSSRETESSGEFVILQNGVFTHFLIDGLLGKADVNKDRIITIKELYSFVRKRVTTFTKNKQTPIISGKFNDNRAMVKL